MHIPHSHASAFVRIHCTINYTWCKYMRLSRKKLEHYFMFVSAVQFNIQYRTSHLNTVIRTYRCRMQRTLVRSLYCRKSNEILFTI